MIGGKRKRGPKPKVPKALIKEPEQKPKKRKLNMKNDKAKRNK